MKLVVFGFLSLLTFTQAKIDWSNVKSRHVNPLPAVDAPPKGRIAGGHEVEEGRFLFQVALFLEFIAGSYFCSGTLISQNYVLTAAQCVYGSLNITVLLGAHNVKTPEASHVWIAGESYYAHEEYDDDYYTYKNDIGLVKLSKPAPLNDKIQLAILPSYSEVSTTFVGSLADTSGWGWVNDSSAETSSVLLYVSSEVISTSICNTSYIGFIRDSQLCVDGNVGSPCGYDYGGPLVVDDEQIGIISYIWSFGCTGKWPVLYTRLTSYLGWIEAHSDVKISA